MKPSVGRIVHANIPPLECVAAIVTAVISSDGTILATLFLPCLNPVPSPIELEYDEEQHAGTWHWPEHVS